MHFDKDLCKLDTFRFLMNFDNYKRYVKCMIFGYATIWRENKNDLPSLALLRCYVSKAIEKAIVIVMLIRVKILI